MLSLKNRDELIKAMRADGKTYREIAEIFHCSKQWVYQCEKKAGRTKKNERDIERIRFQGVYDLFKRDDKMTFQKLQRMLSNGHNEANLYQRFRLFLTGKNDSCLVTINNIRNLIEASGMTFEELFKEREI